MSRSPYIKAEPGMKHSVIYTDDSGKHFRYSGGTWAWRNHNPGNIRPGKISRSHHQIGIVFNFAVFPNDRQGHLALLDVLKITYANSSIDEMMGHFAPPKENNTAKYRKFLHQMTGVQDSKKIKNFTTNEFEKLWQGIEKIEGSKNGHIIEVYKITKTRVTKNGAIFSFCIAGDNWISKEKCLELANNGQVELEVCFLATGNFYLKTPPMSIFQNKLRNLIEKK